MQREDPRPAPAKPGRCSRATTSVGSRWSKGSEPATTVNNNVSALILQNEWDGATPLTSGLRLHQAMKGSRMVKAAGGDAGQRRFRP
ncbi:alpha/beta hydrolase [Streptomyces sp. NBC_00400]